MREMIVTHKLHGVLAIWLFAAAVLHEAKAVYNVTSYCSLVKIGTKLPSTEACSTFYVCQNNGYTEQSCDGGYSFDKDRQSCLPAANVDCFYGLVNPCENKNGSFVPQVRTCTGWIYCSDNAEAARGNCPAGTTFKSGECVYGDCTEENDETETTNICNIMPSNTYFGNAVSCSQYQTCSQGQAVPIVGSCENDLMYDSKIGLCNYKANTDCSRVSNADPVAPVDNDPCAEEGATKASNIKCSEYYSCIEGKWKVQSCNNLYWDTRSNQCEGRQEATPSKDCDRCEGSRKQFVNSVDPSCSAYTVCSKGKAVNAGKCETGYFDESAQACIVTDADPKEYAESNGACAAANEECDCGEPDGETGRCTEAGADCVCGLSEVKGTECIVCSSKVDPSSGVCLEEKCSCEERQAAECTTDGCECALDGDDKTKCLECSDGNIEDGVCEATKPQEPNCDEDCDSTTEKSQEA